ncbi:MAG: NUDIX hydrolase [Chloroflexota bacterium]
MQKRVEILSKKLVFDKFIFRIEEVHLRHERFNGTMSNELVRLNLNRGDSVAAIIHDRKTDTVAMVEQFRFSAYEKGLGWLVEAPAGIIEAGEDPQKAMQRELQEELGYEVNALSHISTFFVSPGGTSERIHLYYASVNPTNKTARGGGLESEGEDIRAVLLKVDDALQKIATGEIVDAKTIIGLQWLQLHRSA